jgi:ankyrin repeat protein
LKESEGRSLSIFERLLNSIEPACRTKPEKFSTFAFNWRDEGLFEALQKSWIAAAETLIRHGASVYSRSSRRDEYLEENHWHSSTLQVAVECSEVAAISLLLDASLKQSLEPMTSKKTPPKLDATAHQAYLNAVDHHGRSALHYLMAREPAVPKESESIMRMLLRSGADSRAVCGKGITTVHVAAAIGSTDMLRHLTEKGLDMKARSFHGVTTLHVAAGGSCETPSLIRYLIHEGMDPLDRDEEGKTSLHYAAAACNTVALEALLDALLGVGDLTQLKAYGSSLPHDYNHGDQSRSELFSRCQILLNMANNRGDSLLHVVGLGSNNTLFRYHGDNEHEERATQVRYTARLLLELGADKNKRSDEGRTPLSVLLSLRSGPHSGTIAAKELLACRADPDLPDSTGQTPLHRASRCWWEEGIRDLIEAGANIEAVNHDLSTPLHIASSHGFSQGIQLFLQHNAGHAARDQHGATTLHYAVQSDGHCFPMLIKKGADLEAADDRGSTPLHWAARAGQAFHLRLLLSAGADPTTVDRSGTNAMQLSARYASIISEKTTDGTDFFNLWVQLRNASKKWCREKGLRTQKSPLKRSQSLILRTDQSWGDFSQVRAEEYARV